MTPAPTLQERIEELLHIADENQDDEIQFFEFANVAMQMEFDREAFDNKRANLARQRGNARSVLKRIGSRP